MRKGAVAVVVLVGFLTVVIGAFDLIFGSLVFRQALSTAYPVTTGTVTMSQVIAGERRRQTTTHARIEYVYEVEGRTYLAERIRFNQAQEGHHAAALVARYPAGTRVQVSYDPWDPAEALLQPGLDGRDRMVLMFLTPFTLVLLGAWIGAVRFFRRPGRSWEEEDPVRSDLAVVRLRTAGDPLLAGLAWATLISAVAMLVVASALQAHMESAAALPAFWGLTLAGGLLGAMSHARKVQQGAFDVTVDRGKGVVVFPGPLPQPAAHQVSVREVAEVRVRTVPTVRSRHRLHAPILVLRGRTETEVEVLACGDEERARAVARWLSVQLGVPGPGHKVRAG